LALRERIFSRKECISLIGNAVKFPSRVESMKVNMEEDVRKLRALSIRRGVISRITFPEGETKLFFSTK